MAKALIGYLDSDLRTPAHLTAENNRLRVRVRDLEALVLTLSEENDRLVAARAAELLEHSMAEMAELSEMQPA